MLSNYFLEVVIKIEVKDNNGQSEVLKNSKVNFFKVIKLKNTYEKPSEKKKEFSENIKELKVK